MIDLPVRRVVVVATTILAASALFVSVQMALAETTSLLSPSATAPPTATASPATMSSAVWGQESNGLRLSISLSKTNIQVGDTVLAVIDLENLGPDHDVFLGCNMNDWYDIEIVDAKGRTIPHGRFGDVDCYSTPSSSPLNHGSITEVTVRLNDKFKITDAGSYRATAMSTVHLPSISKIGADGKLTYFQPVLATLTSNDVQFSVGAPASPDRATPIAATDAQFSYRAEPIYPQWAQERGIQGTVVVIVTIGVKGDLVDAAVLKTSHTRILDEAALAAARGSTFTPYVVNGVPREMLYKLVYDFQIDR